MKFHQKAALNGQRGLFMPESTWTPIADLPTLRGKGIKRLALDTETKDPDLKTKGPGVRRGSKIIGLSVCVEDGPKFYLPVGHEAGDGGNLDERVVQEWAREELDPLDCEIVGANIGYDLDFLAEWGVTFPNVKTFHDVTIIEPLLDENKQGSYNLDAIGRHHLGEGKDETLLKQAGEAYGFNTTDQIKSNMWRLPSRFVGLYAEGDADLPLKILPKQLARLEAEGLMEVYSIERRLMPILVRMRRRGVRINVGKVEELRVHLVKERDRWLANLKRMAGPKAELMEPLSFYKALEERGVPVPRTAKTDQPSITKSVLERNKSDELVLTVLNGRKYNTLINTFIDGQILGHLNNGRVHPTFNQIKTDEAGTIGRLSGSNPNLQFIPSRDSDWQEEQLAPLVRAVFAPEDGEEWQRDDMSQIEYRLLAHYAVGQGAEEARAMYIRDPKTSFHNLCGEFLNADPSDKNTYKKIKVTNFCKVYGGGPDKVALTFGCSFEEAVEFDNRYNEKLPFVRKTYEKAGEWAQRRGYVVTILNRRQRFPHWGPARYREETPTKLFLSQEEAAEYYLKGEQKIYRNYPVRRVERIGTYKALCKKLQVSCADMMKKTMVDADEAGITAESALGPFLVTVHDELGSSVPRTRRGDEAGRELTRIMENTIKLSVPVLVDRSRGENWGDAS